METTTNPLKKPNFYLQGFCFLFCSFAIETTFPLSNFKTKHIFGIHMARVKFLKPFGALKAPQFFFYCRYPGWAPNFFHFIAAAPGGAPNFFFYPFPAVFPKWTPKAPLPRRTREIPPKAGVSRAFFF